MSRTHVKTPAEILDYGWDWSAWLAGDTLASSVWTVDAGLTVVSDGNDATTSSVFVGGGVTGASYVLTNRVTTAGGRTAERTLHLRIVDQRTA